MDLATAQAQLDLWLAADAAISVGQSYQIGNRTLARTDAAHVLSRITYWNRVIKSLNATAAGAGNPGVMISSWN